MIIISLSHHHIPHIKYLFPFDIGGYKCHSYLLSGDCIYESFKKFLVISLAVLIRSWGFFLEVSDLNVCCCFEPCLDFRLPSNILGSRWPDYQTILMLESVYSLFPCQ